MSKALNETSVSKELLQRRVGAFGKAVAIILFLSLLSRIAMGAGFGYLGGAVTHPSFWAHAAAVVPVAAVWWICSSGPLGLRTIQVVEGVGLVLTSIGLVVMGAYLPAAAGAATTTAYALTFGLVARAMFVPSSPKHTAWLGFAMGVPLVIAVYLNFLTVDLEVWNGHGFFRKIDDEHTLARSQSIQIGIAWALTTLLAAWATRIIYGLRKDVLDAKKLGEYIVEKKLGEGGMGAVYLAHHGLLKRPTAVKLLTDDSDDPEALERFRREVQMTAKLKHPNTVTIYDYGRTDDGSFYYAMELLEGVTLVDIVRDDGPQPQSRVIHIMCQCAMALHEAHAIGLVHRDIKPNNIMMTEQGGAHDVTKVLDFGLVKNVDPASDASKTSSEAIIGTPAFMSPEQIIDPPSIDARSDLYALGAVGYFLLAGRLVFEGENALELCAQHMGAEPEPPSAFARGEVDPGLEAIIMQCLEKKRDDRPASAAELAERLQALPVAPWSQRQAARWWDTVGRDIMAVRERNTVVPPFATIHAGRDRAVDG